jgi:hypothetical protein
MLMRRACGLLVVSDLRINAADYLDARISTPLMLSLFFLYHLLLEALVQLRETSFS